MTLYQKIKRIARPVVKAYHDDITVHDRAACARMKHGSTAVWMCRSHGSHFIHVAMHGDTVSRETLESLRNGLNWFDAVAKVFGNEDGANNWYLLEQTGETVTPLTAIEARQLFVDRIRALGTAVERAA